VIIVSSCATRIPIKKEYVEPQKSAEVVVCVPQKGIYAVVEESNLSDYSHDTGLIGNLLLSAVDLTVESVRKNVALELLKPIHEGLNDYDFREEFKKVAETYPYVENRWLQDSSIKMDNNMSYEKIKREVSVSECPLVVYYADYYLTSKFESLVVTMEISIYMPEEDVDKKSRLKPVYFNRFSYQEWFKTTRQKKENAGYLADNISQLKNALDTSCKQIVSMFLYDVQIHEGEKVKEADSAVQNSIYGKVIKKDGGCNWVRSSGNGLFSYKY
jgi:hypothetical protein